MYGLDVHAWIQGKAQRLRKTIWGEPGPEEWWDEACVGVGQDALSLMRSWTLHGLNLYI